MKRKKIILFCIVFLFTFTLSSCKLIQLNLVSNEEKFGQVLKEKNIKFLSQKDLVKTFSKKNSWKDDKSEFYYFACNNVDIADTDVLLESGNSVFEHNFENALIVCFGEKYKEILGEYIPDFDDIYYYSSMPIIYFPKQKKLFLLYFSSLSNTQEEFFSYAFNTSKDYVEDFRDKTRVLDLNYNELKYFYNEDNKNKYEIDYFYFRYSEFPKEIIADFEKKYAMEKYDVSKANELMIEKMNEYIPFYDNIEEEYKLINSNDCIFSEVYPIIFYPNENVLIIVDMYYKKI